MRVKVALSWAMVATGLLAGCAGGKKPEVSYSKDVRPILESRCLSCHTKPDGAGYKKSGLSMDSYQELMKGTQYGPVIKPGDPVSSTLVRLIEGKADPRISMPHGGEPLTEQQITTIREWVAQGAKDN